MLDGAEWNLIAPRAVLEASGQRSPGDFGMSLLKRFFSTNTAQPTTRVRICVECGMPVADHKDWCSIRRGQAELDRRQAEGE